MMRETDRKTKFFSPPDANRTDDPARGIPSPRLNWRATFEPCKAEFEKEFVKIHGYGIDVRYHQHFRDFRLLSSSALLAK